MTEVETFLRSIREEFVPDPATWKRTALLLALLALLMIAIALGTRLRLWLASRKDFEALSRYRRLSANETVEIARLARALHVPPHALATRLDLFEKATAKKLRESRAKRASEDESARTLRGLRQKLGFSQPAEHAPLLTTRELQPGTAVVLTGTPGRVTAVTEAYFTVELARPLGAMLGRTMFFTLARPGDARYEVSCSILAAKIHPDHHELKLSHDEMPTRVQLREHVRVPTKSSVILRRLPQRRTSDDGLLGVAHDLSLGGMNIEADAALPVGSRIEASFDFDKNHFRDLSGTIIACRPREDKQGSHSLRVRFDPVHPSAERLLAASISRHTVRRESPAAQ